ASEAELKRRFGARVASLVRGLSDAVAHPKPPWEERKRRYLEHLRHAPPDLKLISAADKLHNARSIRRDLRATGEAVWERFTATRAQTLWYYRAVVEALGADWEHALLCELRAEVDALHAAAGASAAPSD